MSIKPVYDIFLFKIVLILCLFLPTGSLLAYSATEMKAHEGILDLLKWDFQKDGAVKLNGQWEFYWQQILNPDDFKKEGRAKLSGYMSLPAVWNGYELKGKKLPGEGYATYRLKVLLPPDVDTLALRTKWQETAYELWINNTLIFGNGKVGKNRNEMIPRYQMQTGTYQVNSQVIFITLTISNFFHKKGGIRNPIELGNEQEIWKTREQIRAFDLFIFGSLLIMALYHFGLFWFRKKETSTLIFGALCFFFAWRVIFDNNFLVEFFPNLSWGFLYKMYYLNGYLTFPFFVTFFHRLYPDEFPKKLLTILQWIAGIYTTIILFTPAKIYTHTALSYQFIILISLIYIFIILFLAAYRKREGALIFIFGYFFLFSTVLIFLLDDNGIIESYDFMPLGIFGFILAQSIILSMRLARAFTIIEEQSEEIKEMENYLNNVINSMPSILIGLDNRGEITHWNNEAESTTGTNASSAMGLKLSDVFPELGKIIIETSANFKGRNSEKFEKVEITVNNESNLYNIILYPLVTNGVEGTVLRIDNITEIEKKEAQLRQAQKMEIVGTLAGGLAHDFNNVLTGIFGTITILKHKLKKKQELGKEKIIHYLNLMEESSVRARDMVSQLLTLSRKKELNLSPVDCNWLAENIINICENSFDKSITINASLFPEPAVIIADGPQIEQVLLNLCVNSSHAMTVMREHDEPWGGDLDISIKKIVADRHFRISHPGAMDEYYFLISVKDSGVGMSPETVSKIFSPFFTTKDKDKGTGLGLSMVYDIIARHNGFIDVYSEPGIGSRFTLYIPAGEEGENLSSEETEKSSDTFSGEGKIIIVDDEEIMRITSSEILEECGYEPVTFNSGKPAVKYFEDTMHEVKAVLLDMVMPEMSGKEVYLKLKEINPSVKVLLSSGFRHDKRINEILELGVQGFIEKPYSMETLAKAMHDIIESEE